MPKKAVLGAIFIIILGAAAFVFWSRRNAGAPTTLGINTQRVEIKQIPDDADVIFFSTRGIPYTTHLGPSHLYAMDIETGETMQITFEPDPAPHYEHAAVSPDRAMIASAKSVASREPGDTELWVLDLRSGIEKRLVSDFRKVGSGGIDWSPDGFIYAIGIPPGKKSAEIFKVKPDGTELAVLTDFAHSETIKLTDVAYSDLSISEDGSILAFNHVAGPYDTSNKLRDVKDCTQKTCFAKTQIWVAKSDGSDARMVDDGGSDITGAFQTNSWLGDFDPEVSPDNKYVVFSRTNGRYFNFKDSLNTAHDLWIVPTDRSSPARRLTEDGPISILPDWHDEKIIYTEYNEKENYVGLTIINPDGTGKKRLELGFQKIWDGGRHAKFIPL